jgi:hypothetical protein
MSRRAFLMALSGSLLAARSPPPPKYDEAATLGTREGVKTLLASVFGLRSRTGWHGGARAVSALNQDPR